MPLLRKKAFEKHVEPDLLRDDEEVFYCEITDEIFKDYHDFSERIFLCNSTVWTCSMTGKINLTYQEALESEENALKCLEDFPHALQIPVLFLANLTKRISFSDMVDDIFYYTKDRYFVGENLEACFTTNKWKDCHVISVIAPKELQYKNEIITNGSKSPPERNFTPSADLYKYEIEHTDADDQDIMEIMIVDCTQLRRRKCYFSRDLIKLFLKQNVEPDSSGIFILKLESLKIVRNNMWLMIFDGPLPDFQASKKLEKSLNTSNNESLGVPKKTATIRKKTVNNRTKKPVNGTKEPLNGTKETVNGAKKQKQETLTKFLTKNGENTDRDPEAEKALLERLAKKQEELRKQKELDEEKRALIKHNRNEAKKLLNHYLRDWWLPKEDLELEDHLELPSFTPVSCKLPLQYFGDFLSILEFLHFFSANLSTKYFFSSELSFEVLERAFLEKEVAGPLIDLIQMLLMAIFNFQEEETKCYSIGARNVKNIPLTMSDSRARNIRAATLALKWPRKYQGVSIAKLPLYSLTVSEILRLHLLASGAEIKETGEKWRYAQRGAYTNEDDPGFYLRLEHPHILKALKIHNVVQLAIQDKINIVNCLMNQILSYAGIRDIVEGPTRTANFDLKRVQYAERRRKFQFAAKMAKLSNDPQEDAGINKSGLIADNEEKQIEAKNEIEKLTEVANQGKVLLGTDRAYRKYFKLVSVPGIFVNGETEELGSCLDKVVHQYPELVRADEKQIKMHIQMHYLNEGSEQINGNGIIKADSLYDKLLLCTADQTTCPVHRTKTDVTWSFIHKSEQLEQLINTLNKRGIREGDLRKTLESESSNLSLLVSKTPASYLNPTCVETQQRISGRLRRTDRQDNSNMGYPIDMSTEEILENILVEIILELEEKLNGGGLGRLKVKHRRDWRNCIQNRKYEDFENIEKLIESDEEQRKLSLSDEERSRSNTPEMKYRTEYRDPGDFVFDSLPNNCNKDLENTEELLNSDECQKESTQLAIKCLATALHDISEGIDLKFLKNPLGSGVQLGKNPVQNILHLWQTSLLATTSFSQIFLHYGTFDSCVKWWKSALKARCNICKRGNDTESLVLCDSCNMRTHMYCLKPKLKSIPAGDWFCNKCKKDREEIEQSAAEPPRKRRKIFREVDSDDENEDEQDSGNEDGVLTSESQDLSESDDTDEKMNTSEDLIELCKTCGSGGEIVKCDKCTNNYHKECTDPPLRRLPRNPWTCPKCSTNNANKSKYIEYRIYKKTNDSDGSDDEVFNKRSFKRDNHRDDLPLNNAALQELLSDVMRNDDAWPFLRPVHQKEVPDYYDIIKNPMDFGTIKYKLNMGKYSANAQVMKDILLIFDNCSTYNSSADEVYQCGQKLLANLTKKAKELGLKVPAELTGVEFEDDDEVPLKKLYS